MTDHALVSSVLTEEPQKSKVERLDDLAQSLRLDEYDPRQLRVNAESRFRLLFILASFCLLMMP